jgi:hypothetical protein
LDHLVPVASEEFSSKGLRKMICRVFTTANSQDIVGPKGFVLPKEMVTDVDVFHPSMVDWVLGALDTGLVVDHQGRLGVQRESNLLEDILQVDHALCRQCAGDVLRFGRALCRCAL